MSKTTEHRLAEVETYSARGRDLVQTFYCTCGWGGFTSADLDQERFADMFVAHQREAQSQGFGSAREEFEKLIRSKGGQP